MRFTSWIKEMIVPSWGALRSTFRLSSGSFFSGSYFPMSPLYDGTRVNYDLARQLYRNDGDDSNLGAGFCRPIIDRAVEFMGLPSVSSDDADLDNQINRNIERYWAPSFPEIFRNSMRDSLTYVRVWQPYATDPLVSEEERQACKLMTYEPERVDVTYDPQNPDNLLQATIITEVKFPDEQQRTTDAPRGALAQQRAHEVWEVITPESYRFYDKTDRVWLTDWARPNPYGFVPLIEWWNEYDSSLGGGQSDLEASYPFIKAFHEVLLQTLKAHKYHSIPKLKFKVADIVGFMKNNFPDTIDENGAIIPGASIKWQGREVLIMGEQDDLGFVEMESVLSESKTLLEFLVDCIAVASETPEEFFMRTEQGASGSTTTKVQAFEHKIERKRLSSQAYVQRVIKMCLAMNAKEPVTMDILWPETSTQNILNMAQAVQQIVMSLEVLLERKLVSDNTAREALRGIRLFKTMKNPQQEALDAATNISLAPPPAALPADKIPTNGNGKLPVKLSGTNANGGRGQ